MGSLEGRLPGEMYLLFARATAARILVYNWSEYKRRFFDALFNPEIRFNVFSRRILISFDEMLENLCVRVSQYDACSFHRGIRLSTRVLRQI
jgi:hypothetical protein